MNISLLRVFGFQHLNANLLKIQSGFFLLTLAGRCNQLAIAWWVLQQPERAGLLANLVAAAIAVEVVSKPLFGWLGDACKRLPIIRASTLVAAAVSALMFWLSLPGELPLLAISSLMMLSSAIIGIRDPLQAAIITDYCDPRCVADAFRVKAVLSALSLLLGPALGSALIYWQGVSATFAVDTLLVAFAAALVFRARSGSVKIDRSNDNPLRMILSGFRMVYGVKVEWYLALVSMCVNFAIFPFFTVLLPVLVKAELGRSVAYLGLLDCAFAAGILLGGNGSAFLHGNRLPRDMAIAFGFILLGGNLLAAGLLTSEYLLPLAFVAGGIGLMLVNIPSSTVRLLATPQAFRTRAFATVSFISAVANPAGSAVAGLSVPWMGVQPTITVLGVLVACLALMVFRIPGFKALMRTGDAQLEGIYPRRYPAAFK